MELGDQVVPSASAIQPTELRTFVGTTIEGKRLVARARLSHDIPDGPQITSPADGSTLAPGSFVARWNPVPEPTGINVVDYRDREPDVPVR